MKVARNWVKLPTGWIAAGGLKAFAWGKEGGSNQTAALMVLLAIAHRADDENGLVRLPYDELQWATHLSRQKVADGLDVLGSRKIILRGSQGRSTLQLASYDPKQGWAMLPASRLYSSDGIIAFADFHLRKKVELDALKAYLAFVARRDREQNRAFITYEQIHDYAGIPEGRIKPAISLLVVQGLVVVEHMERSGGLGSSHGYRLSYLHTRNHMGTNGRAHFGETQAGDDLF
uniref:Uncharacterized protein n=1 Tax=Cereibacter sphaeroides (strain ATCC 17025 / ATH 2.4.3) TaxID=349102 RepID=A4X0S9_CERS5